MCLGEVRNLTYTQTNQTTTLSNGCLGSGNDEEPSEMRYVMRIAELSESSNLRTQNALPGYPWEHVSSSFGYYLRSTLLLPCLG